MTCINNSAVSLLCTISAVPFPFVTQLRTWSRETHWFHLVTKQVFLVQHHLLLIYLFICLLKFRILNKKTGRYFLPPAKSEGKKNQNHNHDYFHNVPSLSDCPPQLFSSCWHKKWTNLSHVVFFFLIWFSDSQAFLLKHWYMGGFFSFLSI